MIRQMRKEGRRRGNSHSNGKLLVDVFDLQLYIGISLSKDAEAAIKKLRLLAILGLSRICEQIGKVLTTERPEHLFMFTEAVR